MITISASILIGFPLLQAFTPSTLETSNRKLAQHHCKSWAIHSTPDNHANHANHASPCLGVFRTDSMTSADTNFGSLSRRQALTRFGKGAIPYCLVATIGTSASIEAYADEGNDDPFATFGRSLSNASSQQQQPQQQSNWPISSSPLPPRFSSTLDLNEKTQNQPNSNGGPTSGMSLDDVIQDAVKNRKKQIDPRTHG